MVNSSDASLVTSPSADDANATREAREARLGSVLKASSSTRRPKRCRRRRVDSRDCGSSWGANDGRARTPWTRRGIRSENKGDIDAGVYVDDASVRLDSTAPPREGDEDATTPAAADASRRISKEEQESRRGVRQGGTQIRRGVATGGDEGAAEIRGTLAKGMEDDADLKGELGVQTQRLVREFKRRWSRRPRRAEPNARSRKRRHVRPRNRRIRRSAWWNKPSCDSRRGAEARDASTARIQAEREAEKAVKEKVALAKAAAKVQASADKALKNLWRMQKR